MAPIIFPSGTRHSQELQSGAFVIARLANVPIIPAVYQGPLTFKSLFTRHKTHIAFGDPINIDRKTRLNDDVLADLEKQLNEKFKDLDKQIDPTFKYVDVSAK